MPEYVKLYGVLKTHKPDLTFDEYLQLRIVDIITMLQEYKEYEWADRVF